MSGGAFDYQQNYIQNIVEEIEEVVEKAKSGIVDEWGYQYEFRKETLDEFENAIKVLKKAYVYARRIDWFLSGDDGEDNFHKRLKEELEDLPR